MRFSWAVDVLVWLLLMMHLVHCATPPPQSSLELLFRMFAENIGQAAQSQIRFARHLHEIGVNEMRKPETRKTIQKLAEKQLGPDSAPKVKEAMELAAKLAEKAADPRQAQQLDQLEKTLITQVQSVVQALQPRPLPPHERFARSVQSFTRQNQQTLQAVALASALLSYYAFHPAGQEAVRKFQHQMTQMQQQWERDRRDQLRSQARNHRRGARKPANPPIEDIVVRPIGRLCQQGSQLCNQAFNALNIGGGNNVKQSRRRQ
jgi:hypothetical protein